MKFLSSPSIVGLSLLLITGSALAAQPLAQKHVKVFHNAAPESYVEGPGLARMDDGVLVAVVPVVPREEWSKECRVEHSVVPLLRSANGGSTW